MSSFSEKSCSVGLHRIPHSRCLIALDTWSDHLQVPAGQPGLSVFSKTLVRSVLPVSFMTPLREVFFLIIFFFSFKVGSLPRVELNIGLELNGPEVKT